MTASYLDLVQQLGCSNNSVLTVRSSNCLLKTRICVCIFIDITMTCCNHWGYEILNSIEWGHISSITSQFIYNSIVCSSPCSGQSKISQFLMTDLVWSMLDFHHKYSGPLFTKKTPSYGYRDPHDKPKTVWRPSQVYNGNPYTDKTASS